jgi:site-specific DNA-methyltransferase (adenine-specific)
MFPKLFHDNRVHLWSGDCLERMAGLPADSFDAVVTDPPYELGFMGRAWDRTQIAHKPATWAAVLRVMKPGAHLVAFHAPKNWHRLACAIEDAGFEIRDNLLWLFGSGFPKSHQALKPAYEPIVLARKPLAGTVAANVMQYGTGALNISACRVGLRDERTLNRNGSIGYGGSEPQGAVVDGGLGRWPANVCHDGSPEVVEGFPESESQRAEVTSKPGDIYGGGSGLPSHTGIYGFNDQGSAARFFYTAKADADDRIGSRHPTVKPLDLMQWLVRLVTPPGGEILDPFAGTGTTAEAALREGFRCTLIERDPTYLVDIERRMKHVFDGNVGRSVAMARLKPETSEPAPLLELMRAAE